MNFNVLTAIVFFGIFILMLVILGIRLYLKSFHKYSLKVEAVIEPHDENLSIYGDKIKDMKFFDCFVKEVKLKYLDTETNISILDNGAIDEIFYKDNIDRETIVTAIESLSDKYKDVARWSKSYLAKTLKQDRMSGEISEAKFEEIANSFLKTYGDKITIYVNPKDHSDFKLNLSVEKTRLKILITLIAILFVVCIMCIYSRSII